MSTPSFMTFSPSSSCFQTYEAAASLAFLAFEPLSFFSGASFFSRWLSLTALALATAAALRSDLYPFFAVELTTLLYSFLLGVDPAKDDWWVDLAGLWAFLEVFVVIEIYMGRMY